MMKSAFFPTALVVTLSLATSLQAAEQGVDPNSIDVVDAIECHLDVPAYNGFALALRAG